ncbi:MAG: hypothetical protein RBT71_08095 [Flavobacteriales bacterium]|jgi:hypothetical protein|nr:hypothetical protein [Flavobacteriales bacterium]
MIIIFHGRGWLVPVTAIGAGLLCWALDQRHPHVVWSMVGLSGFIDHHFGRRWNAREGRLFQYLRTGEVHEVKPDHSFFWIPMQYWLYIKLLVAVMAVLAARDTALPAG